MGGRKATGLMHGGLTWRRAVVWLQKKVTHGRQDLGGITGLIVGVFTTGFGAVLKFRNDIRFEYHKDLPAKPIDEYG